MQLLKVVFKNEEKFNIFLMEEKKRGWLMGVFDFELVFWGGFRNVEKDKKNIYV